jgi:hypothetical protein
LKRGRPSYFQRTEELLREYKFMENDIKNLEAELEKAREDLIPNTSTDHIKVGQGSTKTPFDTSQTERIGIMLAENKEISGLEGLLRDTKRRYNSLREIRAMLEKDELQFIWLRYDKNKSHTQTMMALSEIGACMSRATYFRFRQVVINKIARYMGLIKSL